MTDFSLNDIYQQNDKLGKQITLWYFMKSKERDAFIEEAEALVVIAQQFEQGAKSKSTKTQLQNIVDTWERLLNYLKNIQDLPALSTLKKISPAPETSKVKESSLTKSTPTTRINAPHPASQLLSSHKVNRNAPLSIPHDPRLRAIYDKLHGIIDSERSPEE